MARIIVIDDDINIRDLLRIHLSAAGLTVTTFEDASTGIRAILESQPDLVMLDLMLPDLGGLEVLKALKSDPSTKKMPVIVLTSKTGDEYYAEAMRLGADAFLTKPVLRDALINGVLNQLAKRAARYIASSADD